MNKFYDNMAQVETLPCGLTVYVAEMPDFAGVHAMYTTDFGSCDNRYIKDGEMKILPAGVAHFLEHKMFENEDGDAFSLYAKTGASANAFTSFDKTSYVFTASENISESLDILLSFVSRPYFTKETVEKEQGIIGQEINMYRDNPFWRMFFGLLSNMYVNHPLKDDIAGTVESIAEITPEMLYECTDIFYSKSNMSLCVAGNITMQQVLEACRRAGLYDMPKLDKPEKIHVEEPELCKESRSEIHMSVGLPMLGVAYKETPDKNTTKAKLVKKSMICSLITETICGNMTPLHRELYDNGLITDTMGGETMCGEDYFCNLFTCESKHPETVEEKLRNEIARLKKSGIPRELFDAAKKSLYGEIISEFDSPDDTAYLLTNAFLTGRKPFSEVEICDSITYEEFSEVFAQLFSEERTTTVVIK